MTKLKTIDSFFKRKEVEISESSTSLDLNVETSIPKEHLLRVKLEEYPSSPSPKSLIRMELRKFSLKSSTLDANEFDISSLICESRFRLPMWDHLVHKLDEIRLFYLKDGLYQIP